MATGFDRIRRRIDHNSLVDPSNPYNRFRGVTALGKKYPWNDNTKKWSTSPNGTYTYNFNLNYVNGEVCGDFLHPGPPYRVGDPFKHLTINRIFPYRVSGIGTYLRMKDSQSNLWEKYVGGFSPPETTTFGGLEVSNPVTALSTSSSLFPDMSQTISKTWNKTKPKLQRAGLFVSIREARDIPRMLRTTAQNFHDIWKSMGGNVSGQSMSPKGAADAFLNQEFGWVPFLADLRQLYAAYHGTEHYMKRITETNNVPTRRSANIVGIPRGEIGPDGKPRIVYDPVVSDTKVSSGTGMIINPVLHNNFFSTSPSWEVREIVQNKATARGKFTFYRPEFDTGLSEYNSAWFEIQRQLTMYGLRLNPSNIWRATPWTWLIDWFTNVAEHFDLITDMLVDSIVANYLFVTERKTVIRRVRQVLPFTQTGDLVLEWDFNIRSTERVGANSPYGMLLSWDSLDPRKIAILTALGITRRRPATG